MNWEILISVPAAVGAAVSAALALFRNRRALGRWLNEKDPFQRTRGERWLDNVLLLLQLVLIGAVLTCWWQV